jgi:hypothetical protein
VSWADDYALMVARRLDESIVETKRRLTEGSPADYSRYREMVGYLRGLEEAKVAALDVASDEARRRAGSARS